MVGQGGRPESHAPCVLAQNLDAEHTVGMGTPHQRGGWVSYTSGPGGMDHLRPDVRAEVARREAARKELLGRLLCEVHVRVYEHDAEGAEMFVSFPDDAALGVDSDRREVAAAVARAREMLASWR